MPYNGGGTFARIHNWTTEAASGTPILPAEFDEQEQDIAAGLSNCMTRDGQGGPTTDIPWNNFGITGLRAPALAGDAANKAYVDTATGARSMGGYRLTNLADPVSAQDAATKAYVGATTTALPAQAGNAGKPLITDGANASFSASFGVAMNEALGAPIPSAATVNLTTATGNLAHVTGTTTITAITIPSGAEREVVFDGSLTLTNGASLILPTGKNIVTAPGDVMRVRGDGAGVARVVSYSRSNGNALVRTAMVLVAGPLTPSAAANVDFLNVFSSQFDEYLVQINGLTVSAATNLQLQFAIAGAVDAAANYCYGKLDNTAAGIATDNGIAISPAAISDLPVSATVRICGVNTASLNFKTVNALAICTNGTGSTPNVQGFIGAHRPANVATGIRLNWFSGANFGTTGTVKIYGVLNS